MNILYVVSEAAPFIKTGGLGDVAGSLPAALAREGHDVRVMLPLYSKIPEEWRTKMEFLFHTSVTLSWRKQYCGLFKLDHDGVTYYFLDNEYYFSRPSVYGEFDDGERFGFFCRGVIELLPLLDWRPEVINCNDWQTALIPIYLRYEPAEFYRGIKTVYTIHNIEYQGRFSKWVSDDIFGLPQELFTDGYTRYEDGIDLMKGAIYKADAVTTVSESYAYELREPYFACGLHAVIADNFYKFTGILNGIDMERFNPSKDAALPKKFSAARPAGKRECKAALCRELGLDENDQGPIIACISRLVGHKGFDMVAGSIDRLMQKNLRLVILGTGDADFEARFKEAESRYPGRISANIMYSEKRASLIYAGADMLLMPSKSEPCGLSQMIAMRYGTLPIVHAVGGLKDTVRNYRSENANGFVFYDCSSDAMLGAIDDALNTFEDKPAWKALMRTAMSEDSSWDCSAKKYLEIYECLI